jgi:hypothetical protein
LEDSAAAFAFLDESTTALMATVRGVVSEARTTNVKNDASATPGDIRETRRMLFISIKTDAD